MRAIQHHRWWHVEAGRTVTTCSSDCSSSTSTSAPPTPAPPSASPGRPRTPGGRACGPASTTSCPTRRCRRRPPGADLPVLDPFVALAHLAAHTRTLRLGTGVTVVPWHHPLVLAKQVASLDRVSRRPPPVRHRGGLPRTRVRGARRAARPPGPPHRRRPSTPCRPCGTAATGTTAATSRSPGCGPSRRPLPPRRTAPARRRLRRPSFRRAVTRGHGWYGYALSPAATADALRACATPCTWYERPAHLGDLEVSVSPPAGTTLDDHTLAAYAEAGVTRLIALPPRAGARDARRPGALRRGARRPHRRARGALGRLNHRTRDCAPA